MAYKPWENAINKILKGIDGITLSDRIWDIHSSTYKDIRKLIANSYRDGEYISTIMKDLRGFLYLPDVDMRTKYWKEFFKEHPPGPGIYKSAYKNMQRLIRTEVTRAYRTAAAEYAKSKTWVKGIQWHRAAGHGECSTGECDEYATNDLYGLGAGVYPPDALPISHPQCQCYITIVPKIEMVDIK